MKQGPRQQGVTPRQEAREIPEKENYGEPKQVEEGHDIPDDEDEAESQQLQLVVTRG